MKKKTKKFCIANKKNFFANYKAFLTPNIKNNMNTACESLGIARSSFYRQENKNEINKNFFLACGLNPEKIEEASYMENIEAELKMVTKSKEDLIKSILTLNFKEALQMNDKFQALNSDIEVKLEERTKDLSPQIILEDEAAEDEDLYFQTLFAGKYILEDQVKEYLHLLEDPDKGISEKQEVIQKLVSYVFDKRDIELDIEYYSDDLGQYTVTVLFPTWIVKVCGIESEYTYDITSSCVMGSDDWESDVFEELIWNLSNELNDASKNRNKMDLVYMCTIAFDKKLQSEDSSCCEFICIDETNMGNIEQDEIEIQLNYDEAEKNVYSVEVVLPTWICNACRLDDSYTFSVSSNYTKGSDDLENDIREEVSSTLIFEFQDLISFDKKNSIPNKVLKTNLTRLCERLNGDEGVDWRF